MTHNWDHRTPGSTSPRPRAPGWRRHVLVGELQVEARPTRAGRIPGGVLEAVGVDLVILVALWGRLLGAGIGAVAPAESDSCSSGSR